MMRDDEIQDALDRLPRGGDVERKADARDPDAAAYAIVYAALAEDADFALPADFAEAMTARVMPAPVRASVYERWILPVLMLVCGAIALPAVVPALAQTARILLGAPSATMAAVTLLLVAAADRLVKRRLTQNSRGAEV